MMTPLFYLVILTACDEKNTTECDPSTVSDGQTQLQMDGEEETFESSWLMTGSALQVNLESSSTVSMITMRLNKTDDGTPADEINDFPAQFDLGDPEMGSATVYFDDQTNPATTDPGTLGSFELIRWDQSLGACFSFSVFTQDGARYDVDSGLMNASENSLN